MSCTSCHGSATNAAPPSGTHGETATTTRAVGSHQAHLVNTNLRSAAIACQECHAVPTSTGHSNGTVDMTWGTLARTGSFSPTWNGTTCTNYCHGSSLGAGGTVTAPSWTAGSSQAACGTCHGAPPPAPHTTSTSCGTCHTGYTATTVNKANHMNGVLDVTSNHPAGWSAASQHGYQANLTGLAGCKSCHGTDLAGGSSGVSCTACHSTNGFPTWDSNCTFCHGNRSTGRQSPPLDVQGRSATTNVSVGRHDKHVTTTLMAAVTCTQCHPARSGSVITDPTHVDGNGVAEVTLATLGGMTGSYSRASATSATCTTYCHSNGQGTVTTPPNWTSTTAMTCGSCHLAQPSSGHHTSISQHVTTCSRCHGGTYTTTAADASMHIDGTRNVGAANLTWNATNRSCGTTGSGCHGSNVNGPW
jgi:predicted CxxxxCH...CXXCH cytochrome family protein